MIDRFVGDYAFLSNFYPCEISFVFTGDAFKPTVKAPSVEHAYQAQKATNIWDVLKVVNCYKAGDAKRMGRNIKIRPEWEAIKLEVMEDLLRLKFKSPVLLKMLLATGDHELVEGNTWGDIYWGVCGKGGQNHLGRLLMMLRDEYREG